MSEWRDIGSAKVEFDPEYIGVDCLLWCVDFGTHRGRIWRRASGDVVASATGFHGITWTHWMPLPAPPAEP